MTFKLATTALWTAILVLGLAVSPALSQSAETPVTLKASDGITLKGTYYSPGKPGPGLVLLHQCNRDRTAWAPFAKLAVGRGFHVLAMDYRGFGESQGERFESFQEQGPVIAEKWPGDIDAAFTWFTTQPGVDKERIGAAGASCGVNQSAQLARRHPEVKTVVLLSGGVNPDARTYLRDSPWLPVMASASLDDGTTVETMRWILGWSRNPANKFVEYKTAGHGTDMFAVEKELQPRMLEWFEKHLVKTPVTKSSASPAAAPSAVEQFWTTLTGPGGAAKAKEIYKAARARGDKTLLFPEAEANAYGYQLLQEGNTQDAIILFELNVEAFPQSANTYDSLSDAYLAAGKGSEALRFAEKALEVLAADTRAPEEFKARIRESAEQKIRELKKRS
jgi:dienelactone hydrolase